MSSSAQLVLLPWLLRWEPPQDRTAFAAALHAGSCLGIGWAMRDELRPREVALAAAASLPAAVAGLLAAEAVEQRLGRPSQLAALLAGAGALMWWVDARAAATPAANRDDQQEDVARHAARVGRHGPVDHGRAVARRHAAAAGLAQVAALAPGVSRSGATLTALRACGVGLPDAERFSLLMSLPVSAGAAGLTLARAGSRPPGVLPGAAAAAVAGALAARHLRPARSLRGPALYRLGLAAVVARRLIREGAA